MKILVTGGAGYIGSHVVQMLIERGDEVVVFDNLVAGYQQAVHPKATFIVGDLMTPSDISACFSAHTFDGVMHFASHIQVGESMSKPFKYLRDNITGLINLLEVVAEHKVGRFILSSTAALFDTPQRIPIDETEIQNPGSIYGETKYVAERLLKWMENLYGLRYCALRYFNACGAHPDGHIGEAHQPETHLIPLILQVALGQREKIAIFGTDYDTPDGTCVRDYVHVQDLASAHILAMEALASGNSRVYNLGNGTGFSVKEVIDVCRAVTGHPIPATELERRPGDLGILVADSTKIKTELGWNPQYTDLTRIVETAWKWHQSHPNSYTQQ